MEENIRYARDVVGKDPMATYLGIEVEEVREGYARLSLCVKPEYLNALNRSHGIAIYALADQSIAVASNTLGSSAVIIESKINFLKGASEGMLLIAEARSIDVKKNISLWETTIKDEKGNLIATCHGLVYHIPKTS